MFGAGLIAGLLGIGAGALKVLIHDLVMGLSPKVSTTTSNLIIGVTALAGASVYLAAGLIDPGQAAPVILGVVVGAFIGTRIFVRLTNQMVRHFFLVVLAVLGIEMILRGIEVIKRLHQRERQQSINNLAGRQPALIWKSWLDIFYWSACC
jgi:hypothetical protein